MPIDARIPLIARGADPLNALAAGFQASQSQRQNALNNQLLQEKVDQAPMRQKQAQAELDTAEMKKQSAFDELAKGSFQADYYGATQLAPYLDAGDTNSVMGILEERKALKTKLGYPTTSEDNFLQQLQIDPEGAKGIIKQVLEHGQKMFGGSTDMRAQEIELRRQSMAQQADQFDRTMQMREREMNVPRQQMVPSAVQEWQYFKNLSPEEQKAFNAMKRGNEGYSSKTEDQLFKASDAYLEDNAAFENYTDLANRYEQSAGKLSSGSTGGLKEWLKEQTGNEDELTALRKDWAKIKSSEVVKNLPPGAASDADIQMALSGFVSNNADPKIVAASLRGIAKLRKLNAEYNTFKSSYLSKYKNPGGMLEAWQGKAKDIGASGVTSTSSEMPIEDLVNKYAD